MDASWESEWVEWKERMLVMLYSPCYPLLVPPMEQRLGWKTHSVSLWDYEWVEWREQPMENEMVPQRVPLCWVGPWENEWVALTAQRSDHRRVHQLASLMVILSDDPKASMMGIWSCFPRETGWDRQRV